jgi:hypothetical protein
VLLCLSGFHDSHNYSINDVSTFNIDIRINSSLRVGIYSFFLLVCLNWNIVHLQVLILEAKEDRDFLLRLELGFLLVLLIEDLLLRVTEINQGRV